VKEAQTLARHSTPVLTMNTYSRATLLDVAGAVEGLGDLLTKQPSRPEKEAAAMRATGTHGRQEAAPKSDHYSDHYEPAREGSGWHSGASLRAAGCSEMSETQEPESATIPANFAEKVTKKTKRLRSESNRRWRICNPASGQVLPEDAEVSREVTTTVTTAAAADPALAQVVEAWSSLPPAVRAGILAMVEASRR
jgi:hypothetical protein